MGISIQVRRHLYTQTVPEWLLRYKNHINLKIILKFKSRVISLAHTFAFSHQVVLKFCTENDNVTAMRRAKFKTIDGRNFTRLEFQVIFWVFLTAMCTCQKPPVVAKRISEKHQQAPFYPWHTVVLVTETTLWHTDVLTRLYLKP